jgi:tetratricopeptide (TPR) repeat protein
LLYENTDAAAYAELGQAYAETGDYRSAVDALNRALELDPNQVQAYIYLGTAYLHLDNPATAADDFRRGLEYFPDSFDANIGMTEIYYGEGTFGTAYLQSETALAKATNDTQRALAIYWRALCQEKRDEPAAAAKDWRTLLEMPADVMTAQMRQDARDHLTSIVVPTSTARFFGPTYTPTPPPTPTFTLTPRPGNTATPAAVNTP